ncbi:MAG: DNA-binding beta-propeller fold protein YncE, partial [Candidatus Paceibacteria bacterium]
MKINTLISKQTTLLLIITISFATLFLPLTSLQAATLSDGMDASYVIGQADFTAGETTTTQNGLNDVAGVAVDSAGDRVFVSDGRGNRVLVYEYSGGITNGMNASYVLGHPDFVSKGPGGMEPPESPSQANLSSPSSLEYDADNDYLYVVDANYARVLVYDVASITNGENAVYVIGQADFTSQAATVTQSGLSSPTGIALSNDGNTLYVAEGAVGRIVVYDVSTITNGENAINVLGAADFTTQDATTSQNDFSDLGNIHLNGNTLYAADSQSNRIMTFDVSTIVDGENAVNVLGQTDFTSYATGTTAGTMNFPFDAYADSSNNRLFVAESGNSRVTIFDVTSITDGESAVNVLGQLDFTSNVATTSQSAFPHPASIGYDTTDDFLFVGSIVSLRIFDLSIATAASSENGRGYIHPPLC